MSFFQKELFKVSSFDLQLISTINFPGRISSFFMSFSRFIKCIFILFILFYQFNFATSAKNLKPQDQKPHYIGCYGEESQVPEVLGVYKQISEAINRKDLHSIFSYYAEDFTAGDGLNLEKVKKNIGQFFEGTSKLKFTGNVTSIYICGNLATLTVIEKLEAIEDYKEEAVSIPVNFLSTSQGILTMERQNNRWEVISEKTDTEYLVRYIGDLGKEILESGKIKLVAPEQTYAGENYIVNLEYDLPENIQALGFVDKKISSALNEDESENTEQQKKEESVNNKITLNQISRSLSSQNKDGLKRLFKANDSYMSEFVFCQVELIDLKSVETKGKTKSKTGLINMGKRVNVIPKATFKIEERKNLKKSLKEEYLEKE